MSTETGEVRDIDVLGIHRFGNVFQDVHKFVALYLPTSGVGMHPTSTTSTIRGRSSASRGSDVAYGCHFPRNSTVDGNSCSLSATAAHTDAL